MNKQCNNQELLNTETLTTEKLSTHLVTPSVGIAKKKSSLTSVKKATLRIVPVSGLEPEPHLGQGFKPCTSTNFVI